LNFHQKKGKKEKEHVRPFSYEKSDVSKSFKNEKYDKKSIGEWRKSSWHATCFIKDHGQSTVSPYEEEHVWRANISARIDSSGDAKLLHSPV
jgi:hypothetical protein